MPDALVLRLYGILAVLLLLWVILGAPLLPAEWQEVPLRLRIMLAQLPGRMAGILLLWR